MRRLVLVLVLVVFTVVSLFAATFTETWPGSAGSLPGANWSITSGLLRQNGDGTISAESATSFSSAFQSTAFSRTMYTESVLVNPAYVVGTQGVGARANTNGVMYACSSYSDGAGTRTIFFQKYTSAGVSTISTNLGASWSSGDTLRIEVWGPYPETHVQCLLNGQRIGIPVIEATGLSGQLAAILSTHPTSKLGRTTGADYAGPPTEPGGPGPGACSRLLLGIVCH